MPGVPSTPTALRRSDDPAAELSAAAAQSIRTPLAALRASMESLVHEAGLSDPRARALRCALDEVVRLGRSVGALLDLALPQPLRPTTCSLEEIVRSSVGSLPCEPRARVLAAVEDPRSRWLVDGPLVSRCLGHLLASRLEAAGELVLLRARIEDGRAVLTLLGPEPAPVPAPSALGAELARREIARLGGTVSSPRTRGSRSRLEIRIPLEPAPEISP